eukprot:Protomagalhaensia_sp_Gyna_25__6047@NODE_959_length_2354_cov_63_933477_g762_i0_p2_GENE_NODE_959_length_2354_cov_63_933477_g762_i0NODE_959_length_2354_cov_63_933477_g762_i0_p2_ORF_typecomplete_len143_score8_34Gemini_mov/PF01708_16/0_17_NODE_959_length_2354_cov_63_933477_g762_i0548976
MKLLLTIAFLWCQIGKGVSTTWRCRELDGECYQCAKNPWCSYCYDTGRCEVSTSPEAQRCAQDMAVERDCGYDVMWWLAVPSAVIGGCMSVVWFYLCYKWCCCCCAKKKVVVSENPSIVNPLDPWPGAQRLPPNQTDPYFYP